MTTIKAKPTVYRDIRFRSRLEARWAVFFDAIGREWVYEPSFPELTGYQPDFMLEHPDGPASLVEVKPEPADYQTWGQLIQQDRWRETALFMKTRMILLCGMPGHWLEGKLVGVGHPAWVVPGSSSADPWLGQFAECPKCGGVGLWANGIATCCPADLPTGPLFEAFMAVRRESYEDA